MCHFCRLKSFFRFNRIISLVLMLSLVTLAFPVSAEEEASVYPYDYAFEEYWYTESATFGGSINARSALLMEADTGAVLYAQDENARHPIASVTKVMSTLLVMEAIDSGRLRLDDVVTVGDAAAHMGGSQVYLEPGEQMSVDDMLKAMIVVSANDATVAFAEHIAGSEQSFVAMMNKRAEELGMKNTNFANCHGLNEEGHYSSALDVAIMTRELMKHPLVFNYTSIWMDTIRGGAFGLANTNKLIRFYSGATGMKTGFTDLAKYCLSATAKRDNMQLIAVIIGADTGDIRFASAKQLLDFGFANYRAFTPEKEEIGNVVVNGGCIGYVTADYVPPVILAEKGNGGTVTGTVTLSELTAPVNEGDIIGTVEYRIGETVVATAQVKAVTSDRKLTFGDLFGRILGALFTYI